MHFRPADERPPIIRSPTAFFFKPVRFLIYEVLLNFRLNTLLHLYNEFILQKYQLDQR